MVRIMPRAGLFPGLAGFAPRRRDHFCLRGGPALRQILEEEEPCLSANDDIEVSVIVDIDDADLHPSPGPRAVVDDVPSPLQPLFGLDSFIPIHAERLVGAFIVL